MNPDSKPVVTEAHRSAFRKMDAAYNRAYNAARRRGESHHEATPKAEEARIVALAKHFPAPPSDGESKIYYVLQYKSTEDWVDWEKSVTVDSLKETNAFKNSRDWRELGNSRIVKVTESREVVG